MISLLTEFFWSDTIFHFFFNISVAWMKKTRVFSVWPPAGTKNRLAKTTPGFVWRGTGSAHREKTSTIYIHIKIYPVKPKKDEEMNRIEKSCKNMTPPKKPQLQIVESPSSSTRHQHFKCVETCLQRTTSTCNTSATFSGPNAT